MENGITQLIRKQIRMLFCPKPLDDFEINYVEERKDEWTIELIEKGTRVPAVLHGKQTVLDGYCNVVEILTHAFSLKRITLKIYRRRWKEPGSETHYSNTYNLHPDGMKTTKEFATFLKGIH